MNIPENHVYTISIDNLYFIIHSILKILILKLYNVIIFAFFKNLIKSKINLQKKHFGIKAFSLSSGFSEIITILPSLMEKIIY